MSVPKILYLQHGGKTMLAKWVISYFPPHHTYVEPFFGSGAVLLRKAPSPVEIANDKDRSIINVYRQALAHPDVLAAALRVCPYHEGHDWEMGEDTLEAAVQAMAESRQNYTGSRTSSTWRAGAQDWWGNWWKRVSPAVARLKRVAFFCRDAVEVIRKYARDPDALFYVDPPYMGHEKEYRHAVNYPQMVEALQEVRGYVVVSEYPEAKPLWPSDWGVDARTAIKQPKTGKCGTKTEIVILNPRACDWYESR